MPYQLPPPCYPNKFAPPTNLLPNPFLWCQPWSTLVEGGMERYRPPGKLTLELVLANQNKLLCLWTMQLTKWAGKVPYLPANLIFSRMASFQSQMKYTFYQEVRFFLNTDRTA